MADPRRARPTIRCLVDDLGLDVPPLAVDLGDIEHPFLDELHRVAATSPEGQKRILSIDAPLVYRIRVSSERGATWVHAEKNVVWLCAAHRREGDSDNDAYVWFAELHANGTLLPDDDDRLRDRAEAAIRLQRRLSARLIEIIDDAIARKSTELSENLGEWLPCRVIVIDSDGIEEIWCALSTQATDASFISERLRDLLFAALEDRLSPALFEARYDWPTGELEWFEVVRLGMR